MDAKLVATLDEKISAARADIARLTIELVNIPSVKAEPLPGAPFGEGPRRVLDKVLEFGREAGLHGTDYGVGVVSVALKEGTPDVGVWLHGDVVPVGDGWEFEPFHAVEYKGCIIGRGSSDNKGALASHLTLLRILKENNIDLGYNLAVYVGSNEEFGMTDMIGIEGNPDAKGFLNVAEPPRLSLVPDGDLPVGYGGKGGMNLYLKSKMPLQGWSMTAGLPETPGKATADFGGETVSAESPPIHSAKPDPKGNMITKLARALQTDSRVPAEDGYVLKFLEEVSLDVLGKGLHIDATAPDVTPLSVAAVEVQCEDGCLILRLNIRYPDSITFDEIIARAAENAEARGFTLHKAVRGTDPYRLDPNSPMTQMLCRVSNSVTGENEKPYIMYGGTYAHRLPNAYVYGMSANRPPKKFTDGRGGAHGKDEAVSLDCLQRTLRIYARAYLELTEMNF